VRPKYKELAEYVKYNIINFFIPITYIGHCRYGADLAKQLITCLLSVLVSCGSVRISFSDRTPEKVLPADTKFLINILY
jgi:hypothetical protein